METKYSIRDLEHLSGIKAHTIRAWEQRYNLIEPQRTNTNIRYYGDDDLKKILNVAVLVKGGMRISHVAGMTSAELRSAVLDADVQHHQYEPQINSLKVAMLEYDERLFDTVFNKCLLQFGTDCTLTKVLGSLIKQVGTLWQVGAISVSNEHFISNLIKQKLFSIIDQIMLPSEKEGVNSYILYLPAGELHELGLLYLYYYLKKGGHRVIYLGQSVPLAYLKEAALRTNINRFVSIFTSSPRLEDVDEYFHQLQECLPPEQYHFFLTGMQCSNIEKVKKHTRNVTVLPDLETLIKHLK